MNEEQKAQRLAEWLASPEGSDPPEDLDPEVLSAVFVLRPDRTPAPRVSLDDVLAGVKEGPFATVEPTMDNVVEFPRPARPAPEEVRPVREAKKRRSPSRMWVAPILGFGFAAAAAALLSFPMLAKLQSHRFAEPDLSTMPTPAAAPAPEPSPDAMIAPEIGRAHV